jgi:hypothetical protein
MEDSRSTLVSRLTDDELLIRISPIKQESNMNVRFGTNKGVTRRALEIHRTSGIMICNQVGVIESRNPSAIRLGTL